MRVVAANTSGERTIDEGYIIPGTGDKEGESVSNYEYKSLFLWPEVIEVLTNRYYPREVLLDQRPQVA